jgi:predicted DNA-binding protein YlxM (UPF0122 family)
MKEKNLEFSIFLDFYGEMLTAKQREVLEYYYNEDLSLSEIADHEGITRQGVRDSIKRAEALLYYMEERLGLVKRFREMQAGLEDIRKAASVIAEENRRNCYSKNIGNSADEIIAITEKLCDN